MPVLSVVTPVLYANPSFDKTLHSLAPLLEWGVDFEHIIVDSSPQTHQDIYASWKHWPFKILNQEPRGIYAAFEWGRTLAKGDFLWFLNAGDLLISLRDFLSTLKIIQEDPELDAIYSSAALFKEAEFFYQQSVRPNITKQIRNGFIPCHQAVIYRRECFEKFGGFRTDLKIASDVDHHLRLAFGKACLKSVQKVWVKYELGGYSENPIRNEELKLLSKGRPVLLRARYALNRLGYSTRKRFPSRWLTKSWQITKQAQTAFGSILIRWELKAQQKGKRNGVEAIPIQPIK